ncbi:cytochrome P450 [Penicillium malachiteum]|nr:cytochrome P450 [Penicillium malachiteum]
MQEAAIADSFIREVLRMKGDSVNLVRATIRDVELGGYHIPKGSILLPVTYLSYRSPDFASEPEKFDADRWIGSGKSAATTGPGYLAFGLGRWSCPGRNLAVLEIKSWILALVRTGGFELEGNKYEVIDPYNITSVPPKGRLRIIPL